MYYEYTHEIDTKVRSASHKNQIEPIIHAKYSAGQLQVNHPFGSRMIFIH